jgi:DNA repair protein RecO (recombination protein O)
MLLVTEAVVLHVFDYLESSRIFRLATREAGVRSVLARGARRSRRRFGSALDLFASGTAELHTKPGRDLDTLGGFDVTIARPQLAQELSRFVGASAIAELTLRFGGEAADPGLFETVVDALDAIGAAAASEAREAALAGAWRIITELGLAPTVDVCSSCQASIALSETVLFSHPTGGAMCARCARLAPTGRILPAEARAALRAWSSGIHVSMAPNEAKAHQRLLREFLTEHLTDGRPLRAFEVWEHGPWEAGPLAASPAR